MPEDGPRGMAPEAAAVLVAEAETRLWSPEGAEALAYLTGPRRLLTPSTIRAARLGSTPDANARTRDGRTYRVRGIVIPWFSGGTLALVKVRQPEGRKPKYAEVYRSPDRPATLYPNPETVRPGRPVVLTEGEFDALLLGQAIGDLAAVVTLGSASGRPTRVVLAALVVAPRWFIATDADEAGDKAADAWTAFARARLVRPPAPFKDWSEAAAGPEGVRGAGMDLARWWTDILAGRANPPRFTWPELAVWRWGTAADDATPSLEINHPDPAAIRAALRDGILDPEASEERLAIQFEPYASYRIAWITHLSRVGRSG